MHTIYRLPAAEYHRYRTHLLCLDEDSRYMRFGYQIKTDGVKALYNKWADQSDKHVIFAIENDDLEIVAVAHISLASEPVELAFSVFKEYQKQGMGSALMKRCIEYCQNRGIKVGCMVCLSSNEAIKKLALRHGLIVSNEDGETMAQVTMPEVNPASVFSEAVKHQIAAFDHLGKAQRKLAKMLTFQLRF